MTSDGATNDRDLSGGIHAPRQHLVDAVSFEPQEGMRIGLWVYLAEVRVIARSDHRSEARILRGLLFAKNHRMECNRTVEVTERQPGKFSHFADVSMTRLL